MPTLTRDQVRHEVINLQKILKLLERSYEEEDWTRCASKDRNNKWLKAQSILSGISHCRGVLQNVTPSDYDAGLGDRRSMSGQQFHEETKSFLDRLEREMVEINQDLRPRARRPKPILPTLPRPSFPLESVKSAQDEKLRHSACETLIPVDESELEGQLAVPSSTFLIGSQFSAEEEMNPPDTLPNHYANPAATLISPSSSLTNEDAHASRTTRGPSQASTALHEELSNQLAQMAAQLRRNAEQFGEALAKDDGIMTATQEKLERNYDDVTKERIRLRDHSAQNRGTTCLVFMAIATVIIAFFMTFLVIRVT